VRFLHRLRGERKFADMEALRTQITEDVRRGLAWQPSAEKIHDL
jgi:FAD synthase